MSKAWHCVHALLIESRRGGGILLVPRSHEVTQVGSGDDAREKVRETLSCRYASLFLFSFLSRGAAAPRPPPHKYRIMIEIQSFLE